MAHVPIRVRTYVSSLAPRSGFDENKLPTVGSKTRLRHFIRKVEEMVMKLWRLFGQCLVRDTSLRDFGLISSRGNIGTLHFKSTSLPKVKEVVMKLWSPIKTIFDKEFWDVLGFAVLVPFPREAGLHHGLGSYETAKPNR